MNRGKFQIFLVAILPIMAVIGFTGMFVSEKATIRSRNIELKPLTSLVSNASDLVHALQIERGLSIGLTKDRDSKAFLEALTEQRNKTNTAITDYFLVLETLKNSRLYGVVSSVFSEENVQNISRFRKSIDERTGDSISAFNFYTRKIEKLLAAISISTSFSPSKRISEELYSFLIILEAMEAGGLERANGAALLNEFNSSGEFDFNTYLDFVSYSGEETAFLNEYRKVSNASQVEIYDRLVSDDQSLVFESYRETLRNLPVSLDTNGLTGTEWFNVATRRLDLMKAVSEKLLERSGLAAEIENERVNKEIMFVLSLAILVITITLLLVIAQVKAINEQRANERRLRYAASHDTLTGLLNRTELSHRIAAHIETGEGNGYGLILLDLDDFKSANDTLGHDAGDHVLKVVASRISKQIGSNNVCARLGGDEFAVYMKVTSELEVDSLIDRIREPIPYDLSSIRISATAGCSFVQQANGDVGDLFKFSDIALYKAKSTKKGRTLIFKPEFVSEVNRRRSNLEFVRNGLDDGRLVPVFQPIVDLRTHEWTGAEVLLRLNTEEGDLRSPAHFQEAFFDAELGARMDIEMLRQVRSLLHGSESTFSGFRFGVNAGMASMRDDMYVKELLDLNRCAAERRADLCLEIVETVLFDDANLKLDDLLGTLSQAGIKIALDDFGTGYASLSHLQKYPIDCIKIDRSFVSGPGTDEDKAPIARALVDLGLSLCKEVVAEGIETETQQKFLTEIGCHKGQGYKFGKPVPWSEFVAVKAA
ncbi:EAL domain-containing protein [Roseibium aggregatum]|uniref:EAL domain-containing protein n=1 Tax=Roseibium aggregatum TaxID=187304 RepID=A0A926P494_9HYPH|nr:EAL domain-containing protein [Roseibium aggregatum]MBD1549543.1 EAL domain-containing protein [Roseibium aggregatum]